jgi:hypothetical protein
MWFAEIDLALRMSQLNALPIGLRRANAKEDFL